MAKTKAISNVCHHLRNENDNLFLIYFFELRLTSPVYLIWAERQPERARHTVVRRPESIAATIFRGDYDESAASPCVLRNNG